MATAKELQKRYEEAARKAEKAQREGDVVNAQLLREKAVALCLEWARVKAAEDSNKHTQQRLL